MTQERIECPFCGESIMRDAVKCRFCREWLSESESNVSESHSAVKNDNDITEIHHEAQRGAIGDIRQQYLTTIKGIESKSRPIEMIEHRPSSIPDAKNEHDVETPNRVESLHKDNLDETENIGQQTESSVKNQDQYDSSLYVDDTHDTEQDTREEAAEISSMQEQENAYIDSGVIREGTLFEKDQQEDNVFPDSNNAYAVEQAKSEETFEVSDGHIAKEVASEQSFESESSKKKAKIPWLRALLIILYLGIFAALAISESNTFVTLRDARSKENVQKYEDAFNTYSSILNDFPYSFWTIEARQSLRRLSQSHGFEMPQPSWASSIKNLLGTGVDSLDIQLLPIIAWPASAVLLFLVFVSRIFRPGIAFIALLLLALAVAGSVIQLAWYGVISLPPSTKVFQNFMQATPAVYITSYLLLILTALMTLTATRKHKNQPIATPEQLWDVADGER